MGKRKKSPTPKVLSEEYVHDSDQDSQQGPEKTSSEDASRNSSNHEGSDVLTDEIVKDAVSGTVTTDSDLEHSSSSGEDEELEGSKAGDESADDRSTSSHASQKRGRQEKEGDEPNAKRSKSDNAKTPVKVAARDFVPPDGYSRLTLDAPDFALESADLISSSAGKQVWHISTPAAVNLSSIKELDLEAAMRGESIFSQSGVSYCMQEAASKYDTLLVNSDGADHYVSAEQPISRSFSLRMISESNNGNTSGLLEKKKRSTSEKSSPQYTAREPGQKKPPRQQPEGLRMRYEPFGSRVVESRQRDGQLVLKKTSYNITNGHSPSKHSKPTRLVISDLMVSDRNATARPPDSTSKSLSFASTIVEQNVPKGVATTTNESPKTKSTKFKGATDQRDVASPRVKDTNISKSELAGPKKVKKHKKPKLMDGSSL